MVHCYFEILPSLHVIDKRREEVLYMYLAWIFHTRLNDESFSDKTPWYLRFRIKSWKIPVVHENFGRLISQKWDIWSQRFNRPLPSDTWRTREDLVSTAVSVTVIMKRMGEFCIHRVMPGKVHTYLVLVDSDWDSVEHQFLTDREDGGFFQSRSTQCLFTDREHQNVCCGIEEDTQPVCQEGVTGEPVSVLALLELTYEQFVASTSAVASLVLNYLI